MKSSDKELQRKWEQLLKDEERLFEEACELYRHNNERTPQKSEKVREWWLVVNSVLWMFTRTKAQNGYNLSPDPLFTLARLANISEELANGNVPAMVRDVAKSGRTMTLGERKHIAIAVLYVEAAKRGDISDKSPVITVARAYNVTRKTVQNWQKKRDELCVGVRKDNDPEWLTAEMHRCGGIYTRIGRGAPSDL